MLTSTYSPYKNPPNHFENIPIGNKKDRMSIHSNEPLRPLSRQELPPDPINHVCSLTGK